MATFRRQTGLKLDGRLPDLPWAVVLSPVWVMLAIFIALVCVAVVLASAIATSERSRCVGLAAGGLVAVLAGAAAAVMFLIEVQQRAVSVDRGDHPPRPDLLSVYLPLFFLVGLCLLGSTAWILRACFCADDPDFLMRTRMLQIRREVRPIW